MFRECIFKIISEEGIEVLNDKNRFLAYISDLSLEYPDEKNFLVRVCDETYISFFRYSNISTEKINEASILATEYLIHSKMVDHTWAKHVSDEIAAGICKYYELEWEPTEKEVVNQSEKRDLKTKKGNDSKSRRDKAEAKKEFVIQEEVEREEVKTGGKRIAALVVAVLVIGIAISIFSVMEHDGSIITDEGTQGNSEQVNEEIDIPYDRVIQSADSQAKMYISEDPLIDMSYDDAASNNETASYLINENSENIHFVSVEYSIVKIADVNELVELYQKALDSDKVNISKTIPCEKDAYGNDQIFVIENTEFSSGDYRFVIPFSNSDEEGSFMVSVSLLYEYFRNESEVEEALSDIIANIRCRP